MTADDFAVHARELLDANSFLTLGTIDPSGRPWTSPVYFAASGLREFYWTSQTDAVHSRNPSVLCPREPRQPCRCTVSPRTTEPASS